jgi:hypothetical protein
MAAPPSGSHRLLGRAALPLALLFLTLAAVTVLSVYRVSEVTIDLDVVASDVEFTVTVEQPVTTSMSLVSLGIAGARDVTFPPDINIAPVAVGQSAPELSAIDLAVQRPELDKGSITLRGIVLPAGTRVSVHAVTPQVYRVTFEMIPRSDLELDASIEGDLKVTRSDGGASSLKLGSPKLVTVAMGTGPLQIDLGGAGPADRALALNLEVADLALSRIEHVSASMAARRVSSIKSGSLYIHDLERRQIELRGGEDLEFSRMEGALRTVALVEEGMRLSASGRVRGMRAGSTRQPVDLMPSALQWLAANRTLTLVWTSVLYFAGLLLAIARWWRHDRL